MYTSLPFSFRFVYSLLSSHAPHPSPQGRFPLAIITDTTTAASERAAAITSSCWGGSGTRLLLVALRRLNPQELRISLLCDWAGNHTLQGHKRTNGYLRAHLIKARVITHYKQ